MIKAIGFNGGQYGDLCINVVACKAFKEKFPDSYLFLGISNKYQDISSIFMHNPFIDDVHIWEGYSDWPTEKDMRFMKETQFDLIFRPNPSQHTIPNWYNFHHQTEEVCYMHGLTPPKDLSVTLNPYFPLLNKFENYVALTPFTGWGQQKNIPLDLLIELIDLLHKEGLKTVQLGLPGDLALPKTEKPSTTYFEAVQIMLSCKMLITADTGMSWVASGYKQNVLGLYKLIPSYLGMVSTKNIEPINPNASYVSSGNYQEAKEALQFRLQRLDVPRLPNRPALDSLKSKTNLVGVEVGVERGLNAANLFENFDIKHLYLVDPYRVYEGLNVLPDESMEAIYQTAKARLAPYEDRITWLIGTSEEVIDQVPDNLDFAYLDGNHKYQYVLADIRLFFPKVKKGGLLGGHDLNNEEVKAAVIYSFLNSTINGAYCRDNRASDWWIIKEV